MRIETKEQALAVLEQCKAKDVSAPKVTTGSYYQIMSQNFQYPDDSIQPREYVVVKRTGTKKASVVIPITTEGYYLFIAQPIALVKEKSLYEVPAGMNEQGELEQETGIRELEEETGYTASNIVSLGSHYQDPALIRDEVEVYLALGCTKTTEPKLDRGEYIIQTEIAPSVVEELLDDNYIKDANTYIALAKTEKYLKKQLGHENKKIK